MGDREGRNFKLLPRIQPFQNVLCFLSIVLGQFDLERIENTMGKHTL